jgi:peptide deformylase
MLAVVKYPNAVLVTPCELVTEFDVSLQRLIEQMVESMYVGGGVGLAAPQVNVNKRLLVIDSTGGEEANQLLALINPSITWRSRETDTRPESCLSMPGVVLQVPRAVVVDVEYHDVMGKQHKKRFTDFPARIVQHEIDHLDGLLMFERVGQFARRLAMKGLGNIR